MRPTSKLSPEIKSISELITEIASGEIKVPQFQRGYVWSPQQALNLLDSIANNYPIGSILLWRTTEELPAARNISNFQLPEIDATEPTDYVLDGQQRLTVIYSCLGASLQDTVFQLDITLKKSGLLSYSGKKMDHSRTSSLN